MKRVLVVIWCLLLFAGCATTSPNLPIRDIVELPQDAGAYHELNQDERLLSSEAQQAAYTHFLAEHFGPWERREPKHTAEEVFWGLTSFSGKTMFGQNTLPRDSGWMERMRILSRVEHYPSMHRRAITVTNASMRVLPTNTPLFHAFTRPGEGFPFDYMQNSLVLAGTPLLATHISADQAWVLVESRFTYGWIHSTDIAWVEDKFASIFQTGAYAAITRDDVPISDANATFLFMGHVGTILPIMDGSQENNGFALMVPTRAQNGLAIPSVAFVPSQFTAQTPIPATPANFTKLANAMMGRQYGWGGLYEDRDCSASIMDLMAGFGIYLPRNSSQQIKVGAYASLDGMSRQEKKHFLSTHATPFLTTIRKPGHIMLYVGKHHGQPVVFHSTWGLKTRNNGKIGRKIIGSTVITTLEPGMELRDLARPEGVLLETVSGMATLPGIGER